MQWFSAYLLALTKQALSTDCCRPIWQAEEFRHVLRDHTDYFGLSILRCDQQMKSRRETARSICTQQMNSENQASRLLPIPPPPFFFPLHILLFPLSAVSIMLQYVCCALISSSSSIAIIIIIIIC